MCKKILTRPYSLRKSRLLTVEDLSKPEILLEKEPLHYIWDSIEGELDKLEKVCWDNSWASASSEQVLAEIDLIRTGAAEKNRLSPGISALKNKTLNRVQDEKVRRVLCLLPRLYGGAIRRRHIATNDQIEKNKTGLNSISQVVSALEWF